MSKDKNFERRMIVSKYSNRPPFDLKKPKDSYDIEDKIKAYPDESCKSCCGNRIGRTIDIARSSKYLPTEVQEEETKISLARKVIPKIIETFQKLAPPEYRDNQAMSKNTSIHTLYRNSKTCNLGRNIPKHKLMKSLLQNLNCDGDHCKKSLSEFDTESRDRLKQNTSIKQFFDKDAVIRPEFSVSFDLKKNAQNPSTKVSQDMISSCSNIPRKVDKRTSTTGLAWPPTSREMLQYSSVRSPNDCRLNRNSSHSYRCEKTRTSSFSTIKEERRKKTFISESFLEQVPTRDVAHSQKVCAKPSMPEKGFKTKKNEINDHFNSTNKPNARPSPPYLIPEKTEKRSECRLRKSTDKLKLREKTFVQTQVEKLDKVMKNTKFPCQRFPNQNGQASKRHLERRPSQNVEGRRRADAPNIKGMTANYIGLMDKVRNDCPHFDNVNNYQSSESDHGWSDTNETEIVPEQIRFPRETKTAICQRLNERRPRIPLSKFAKVYEHCTPAMPPHIEFATDHEYFEDYSDPNQPADYKGQHVQEKQRFRRSKESQKPGSTQNKPRLSIPCKKNLLCDKGEQHSGPCGYTHNHNKVIY